MITLEIVLVYFVAKILVTIPAIVILFMFEGVIGIINKIKQEFR